MAHLVGKSSDGQTMHYSVGAVVEKDGKYLLIDRSFEPFGFAGLAGHVDEGESSDEAIDREVQEESGLNVRSKELLFEEELSWNWCVEKVQVHHWRLYRVVVEGDIQRNEEETRSIGWYTKEEVKGLKLEEVWGYWFKKMGIVN